MSKPRLAFLGIGLMGAPMATNLLRAGFPVTVWNRTRAKAETLATLGATVAESAAAAVAAAEIVIDILESGSVVEAVILGSGGVAQSLPPGGIVIDMSSIEPARARRIGGRLAEHGIGFIDAPVSGGTSGAREGTLAIMAGGSAANFERAKPVLETMGRVTHVGPTGSGQVVKLCNQAIVATTVLAVSEAMLLANSAGIDPAAMRAALRGGSADSGVLRNQGSRLLARDFRPSGSTKIVHKDCVNILAEARSLGLTLPIVQRAADMFTAAMEHGSADYDHTSVLLELERMNPGKRAGTKPDQFPG